MEITLADGRRLSAGPLEARGEPRDPGWADVVTEKVTALVDPDRDLSRSRPLTLALATEAELLGLLCAPILAGAHA